MTVASTPPIKPANKTHGLSLDWWTVFIALAIAAAVKSGLLPAIPW